MSSRRTRKKARCKYSEDFYNAVNGQWNATTHMPDTETRITQAYFMTKEINKELDTIIREESKIEGTPISRLLSSWDVAVKEDIPAGLSPILGIMMAVESTSDVCAKIGWMIKRGIPTPLSIYIEGDPRDNRQCRIIVEEGEPGIGIPEYWWHAKHTPIRHKYGEYVGALSDLFGIPQMKMGYNAEASFAEVYPTFTERKKKVDTITWSELRRDYTLIDWDRMMLETGVIKPETKVHSLRYNITSRKFLHHMQQRLESWSMERWRGWLTLMVAQWAAGICPPGRLRSIWFDFSQRFMQGMPRDPPVATLRMDIVRKMLPWHLGERWVKSYCSPSLKPNVLRIVNRIRESAISALSRVSWMKPTTRAAAIEKLTDMDLQIGWPKYFLPVVACGMSDTDYISNLMEINLQNTIINGELVGRHTCRHPTGESWSQPVYDVNAYYFPLENRFMLPAAILRPPFYDPRRSVAWNYGSIGATIGHEFCHAFDSEGRMYDENGNEHFWWTRSDDREYKKRAKGISELFSSVRYRGHKVDGELTEVENIADLGGLEFALAGAAEELGRPLTKAELREFFISFAISWRSKDRRRRAIELLATDSHSPPKLRVNQIVRQLDAWYEAFDITPDCKGYIPPEKRIHFFST